MQELFLFPGVKIVSLAAYPQAQEVAEDGTTFEENASKKALGYAAQTGCLTIADDSGLSVDFLSGRPGIYSARYAGPGKSDRENCRKVLEEMAACPAARRGAHFTAAVAVAEPGKLIALVSGACYGFIASEPKGSNGFGYDPIFYFPAFNATFGEIDPAQKHRVSHRAEALDKAKAVLEEYVKTKI